MSQYIHHLPGRLRVKSPHLKGDAGRAHAAREQVSGLDGVLGAEANPITGSLLIHYDLNRVGAEALLDALRRQGHLAAHTPLPGIPVPGYAQRLADTMVHKLVETAIERSATALLAAIL